MKRLDYLIGYLLSERNDADGITIPEAEEDKFVLYRSLVNIRPPMKADEEYLRIEEGFLREQTLRKGITDIVSLAPVENGIYLWQGDITTLRCDAIVNAANSGLTGCYMPCHGCIDNCIHTYAGIRLRDACAGIIAKQGHEEPTGQAKITPGFALPCKYVLHTVGPIITGTVTGEDDRLLASCYRSCLALAEEYGIKSIAFCCISTGEFRFPNRRAAEIAVGTVREYRQKNNSGIEVVFNVWKDIDHKIYRELLG